MPKYLVLWEVDSSRAPVNPKERGAAWLGLLEMVKQDLKEGKVTEWGLFAGESAGFNTSNMTEVELGKSLQKYYPWVTFKVHQYMSADQAMDVSKSLTK
jgi:hypothetical protein